MALGLSLAAIQGDLDAAFRANAFDADQAAKIALVLAAAIDKNNREIDKELGRRFADIERKVGRS